MLQNLFKFDSELVLIIDRNQWQNTNILMISVPQKKRALPIYWHILSHKIAINLTEKKAVICTVLRLLKDQKIMITADREFRSIFRAHQLKKYQTNPKSLGRRVRQVSHSIALAEKFLRNTMTPFQLKQSSSSRVDREI